MQRGLEAGFDPTQLPPIANDLAEVIGLAALLALVRWRGGLRLFVPGAPTEELVSALGQAAAEQLCGRFAGERITIPTCAAAVRAARDAEMRTLYAQGTPAVALALAYGVPERQVWRILACDPGGRANAAERGRQRKLF